MTHDGAPPPYSPSPSDTGGSASGSASDARACPNTPSEAREEAPPIYTARKRLLLWSPDGPKWRAHDFTDELSPETILTTAFSLDRRNITHVRHGSRGCSASLLRGASLTTPRHAISGGVEMWSDANRTQEYHWGGELTDNALKWRLTLASDGAARRDGTVVDLYPDSRVHTVRALAGAREVRTGKPDRGLRAALTADGGLVAWHVQSQAYAYGDDYLSQLPTLDVNADVRFKPVGKADEHWSHWVESHDTLISKKGRRRARDMQSFDIGDVVIALRSNGDVWICSDLEWYLLCVVERPETVGVAARGHLVAVYRLPSPSEDDEPSWDAPAAYVVDLRAGRVHPVLQGGDGQPFAEVALHPVGQRYQASARTRSGEVHAWVSESLSASSTPRISSTSLLDLRPSSSGSGTSSESTGVREGPRQVTLEAPQMSEIVELPHPRGARLFPISVGVGCALCVSIRADEPAREKKEGKRGLGMIGLGLLGKGKGRA